MDEHKFCFIICTNNDLLLEEAIHYIQQLRVPDGYTMELLTIADAVSMTAGYQEAMEQSDAKYKIYMHQDVFILNRGFLSDLLEIFQSDETIGMVGMIGYDKISSTGMMWKEKRVGGLYAHHPQENYMPIAEYQYDPVQDGFAEVALIDGFMMVTSKDIRWETELLKKWDFYDVFQSIAFLKAGYRIVVPMQRHPWCLHDDNGILNLENYDTYRQVFMREYPEVLGKSLPEIRKLFG